MIKNTLLNVKARKIDVQDVDVDEKNTDVVTILSILSNHKTLNPQNLILHPDQNHLSLPITQILKEYMMITMIMTKILMMNLKKKWWI